MEMELRVWLAAKLASTRGTAAASYTHVPVPDSLFSSHGCCCAA